MIKNLNQLKKAMKKDTRIKIIYHWKKDCVGQIRKVTKPNTVGFYSVVDGQPEHPISQANHGLGWAMDWGKAGNWVFENGICSYYKNKELHGEDDLVMSFHIIEEVA